MLTQLCLGTEIRSNLFTVLINNRLQRIAIMDISWIVTTLFVLSVLFGQGFVWGVNTTFSISSQNNGFLGTQLTLQCDFYPNGAFFVPRRVEYFRTRSNQAEEEIVRETIEDSSTPQWTDINLSQRSNLQRPSRTSATLTVNQIECDDTATYTCRFFVGNLSGDVHVSSSPKAFQVTAPPKVPGISYQPKVIVENEPVEFTCSGNVGLPAGSLQIYLVRNGVEENLNAENGLVESVVNSCTFERSATVRRNFSASENDALSVRCRVSQNFADRNIHFNQTQQLSVMYTPRETKMFQSLDGGPRQEIQPDSLVEVPVSSRLTLTCETDSNPASLYVWSYVVEATNETKTESPTSTGSFYLNPIMMSHTGHYTCTVSNTIRNITYTDTVTMRLNVSSIPTSPPTLPTSEPTGNTDDGQTTVAAGNTGTNTPTNNAGLIGGIVGALCGLLVIIIIVVIMVRRKKNNQKGNNDTSSKPKNNQDPKTVVVHPHMVSPNKQVNYDNYNKAFEKNEKDLYYADLKFDDTPRSRKPVQILDNQTNYAEVAWPRV